ncbi:MAG: LysE family transporter [Pseudomonadota bacterium]
MLSFAAACCLLFLTPGPGVLTLAGVGAGFGWRAGLAYGTGLFIGNSLVAVAVISGLAAIVLAEPLVRSIAFIAASAYLLYLAAKVAFAGAKVGFIDAARAPGVGGGIALQAINPKAYVVHTTLFTGFTILPDAFALEVTVKFAVMSALWIAIHLLWLGAGVSIHRLDLAPAVQRAINIAMALAMVAVVFLAAFS